MNAINNNALKKIEIKKLLKEYQQEIIKINDSSKNIKYLGYRFHTIYKILLLLSQLKSIYYFNFNYLLNILNNLIKNINKKMIICNFNQLIKKFTHNCFLFILNSINKKDTLFFLFIFYTSLIFEQQKLNSTQQQQQQQNNNVKSIKIEKYTYYSLFIKINNLYNININTLNKIEWLNIKKKRQLIFIQKEYSNLQILINDIQNNTIEYFNWYKQTKPEENLFFLKKIQLNTLEIILFIYIMRKDRLFYYIYSQLKNYLDLTETLNFSLPSDLNYIDAKTFLYITEPNHSYDYILSKCNINKNKNNYSYAINHTNNKNNTTTSNNNITTTTTNSSNIHNNSSSLKILSVGNNLNNDIQISIETSLQNGKKLLLENFHLINFNIDKFYEIYNNKKIHSNFQLILTAEKYLSLSIIKKAIKIYAHKEQFLKTLILDFFIYVHNIYKQKLKNNFINSFLFSLSFFHTILICRCNYNNFGFDHFYYFDNKDFETTFDSLIYYFNLIQQKNVLTHLSDAHQMDSQYFNQTSITEQHETKEVNINWQFVK